MSEQVATVMLCWVLFYTFAQWHTERFWLWCIGVFLIVMAADFGAHMIHAAMKP